MSCTSSPISSVPWSAFTDGIVMHVSKAPNDIMEYAIRQAAIEFAQVTLQIQRDIFIDLQENVQDYVLEAPDGYSIYSVREVSGSSVCSTAMRPVINPPSSYYDLRGHEFYFENPDRILIGASPPEDRPCGLLVRATVVPGQDSCSIDQWIYDRYAETIALGALHRLLGMPTAAWFARSESGVFMRRWKTALNRAKGAAAKGHVSGPTLMRPPRFV